LHRITVSELVKSRLVSFSLKSVPFDILSDHVLKNAGIRLNSVYSSYDWVYLSNFYASSHASPGFATKQLQMALSQIQKPFILCCEPLLGTDPRSITAKNCEMVPEERYKALCGYYKVKFNLQNEIPTCCTLKTGLTGHGKRWSDLERKFIFGAQIPGIYCHPISLQICSQTLLC
jgi:hypothetical protein